MLSWLGAYPYASPSTTPHSDFYRYGAVKLLGAPVGGLGLRFAAPGWPTALVIVSDWLESRDDLL